MDANPRPSGEGTPPAAPGESRLWLLLLAALFVWQGWMTLNLFGTDRPCEALRDDRPILSGRHALHLYHGHLGADTFLRNGSISCYDPAFQAGYPKTPVFDGGSRPAELFLCAVGGDFRPDVYKIGLALGCLMVPLALSIAARGIGLNRRAVVLAVALGLMVWWGKPGQAALHAGELDLLLGGLAALVLSGMLIRFHRKPGGRAWLGVLLAGFIGWLFQPLLIGLLMPLFLIYYLSVGTRHRMIWSVLLFTALFLGVVLNWFWLCEWVDYWWLRVPLSPGVLLLPHRTFATLWRAELWGEPLDRGLTVALLVLAAGGAVALHAEGNRPAARLFGLAALLLVLLAIGGIMNDDMARLSATSLLVPGLLFAVPPAARAVEAAGCLLRRLAGRATVPLLAAAVAGVLAIPDVRVPLVRRWHTTEPLVPGLNDTQKQIVEILTRQTTPEARILWETRPDCPTGSGWTTLLPLLTGRSFVGGLDAGCAIEHTADGLARHQLAGYPVSEWTDDELDDYCRRFNIGWVVCWTQPTRDRFARWAKAERTATLGPNGEGVLMTLKRPRSYVLKGQARWLGAEVSRVRLADVVPENGVVVLSLHYQEGLVASPGRVKVDYEIDPRQDIPFVRLRVDAPVAYLTLVWQP